MITHTIGIDCRLGGIAHAGIGRYVAELVQRITKSTQYTWVLFCTDKAQATELLSGQKPNSKIRIVYAPIQQYSFAEQMVLPDIFNSLPLDLLHVPHFNVPLFYNKPIVITIHDLLWHEYRGTDVTTLHPLMYWPKYWAYRWITQLAVSRAKKIFVPTQTVSKTVLKHYPTVAEKITVTYEGIGSKLSTYAPKVAALKRERKHLLYVGSLYPHKNISVVLSALQKMPEYTLEIVGSRNAFQDRVRAEVEEKGIAEQVLFSGRISDAALATEYAQATTLIQPSLSEGFGLTGLEALAFNTPVIASDIPIFHEVYKDAAIYFNPHSPESFIQAVEQVEKPSVQLKLQKNAVSVRAQFSWDTLASETLAGYAEVLAKL
jgi:glycosyltransferase involved in cell wall biosynthesis